MKKPDFNSLNIIFDKFKIGQGSNILLNLDLMRVLLNLKNFRDNKEDASNLILNFIMNRIGQSGNLAVPVFNEDSINHAYFDRIKSPGQSGAFGNFLIKKNYLNRSVHPYTSFLFFGSNSKKYINMNNHNSEGIDSPWTNFINDNFNLVTIGHHYQRSFTIIHYLESLAKVNYRYNKNFNVKYKDFDSVVSDRVYSFFARKVKKCQYSSITIKCDNFFMKENIAKYCKDKNLISFNLDLKSASQVLLDDLKNKKQEFISWASTNDFKKNKHILFGKNLLDLENSLLVK